MRESYTHSVAPFHIIVLVGVTVFHVESYGRSITRVTEVVLMTMMMIMIMIDLFRLHLLYNFTNHYNFYYNRQKWMTSLRQMKS